MKVVYPLIRFHLEIGLRGLLIEWLAYPEFRRMRQFMELFRKIIRRPLTNRQQRIPLERADLRDSTTLSWFFPAVIHRVASFCLENQCLLPSWDQCIGGKQPAI